MFTAEEMCQRVREAGLESESAWSCVGCGDWGGEYDLRFFLEPRFLFERRIRFEIQGSVFKIIVVECRVVIIAEADNLLSEALEIRWEGENSDFDVVISEMKRLSVKKWKRAPMSSAEVFEQVQDVLKRDWGLIIAVPEVPEYWQVLFYDENPQFAVKALRLSPELRERYAHLMDLDDVGVL